jgi:opacity protein-like surface antigen
MKKFLVSAVAFLATTSAFAADPIFGPAKPPVKQGTGTFKAQSLGYEVKSVNDVKIVGIYDNKNGNGAVQKPVQSFEFQGIKAYTTATLSTNADVNKAYAGASAMVKLGTVVPGIGVDAGITVRGLTLDKSLRPVNSYHPTVTLNLEPVTLVRHITSTPSRVEKTTRKFLQQVF